MEDASLPPIGKLLNDTFGELVPAFLEYLLAGIGVWFVESLAGIAVVACTFGAVFTGLYLESQGVLVGCTAASLLLAVAVTVGVNVPLHAGMHRAVLRRMPAGNYEVEVRHPRKRKTGSTPAQRITMPKKGTVKMEFVIALKPTWRPQRTQ